MSDLFQDNQVDNFLNIQSKVKDLSQQIDWIITHKQTKYLSEMIDLQNHKSVAIRRKIASGIGTIGSNKMIEEVKKWQTCESDRQTYLLLEDTIDKLKRKHTLIEIEKNNLTLTVSEALAKIKRIVGETSYIIEGELAEIQIYGVMYYFALKDSQNTRINCTLFSGKLNRFGFPLNDNWSVRATGKFKIDQLGKLKFEIENLQLTGEGQLLRNLKLLEEKLELEGLFDSQRKRLITKIPNKILLLASPSSAAIDDFQKVLKNRRKNITIYYLPIKTQGVGAEIDILTKIDLANRICKVFNIQTVVITRGGGSKDDLMIFNSEKIVRAIFSLIVPSIVAIGHERDNCLAEKVADMRASTPSNAAEIVSLSNTEINYQIKQIESFWYKYFMYKKNEYLSYKNSIYSQVIKEVQQSIRKIKFESSLINNTIYQNVYKAKAEIRQKFHLIEQVLRNRIIFNKNENQKSDGIFKLAKNQCSSVDQIKAQQFNNVLSMVNQKLFLQKNSLDIISQKIQINNPKEILSKGYTIITQNKEIVTRSANFNINEKTTIEWYDDKVKLN
jgi:exodeoxyribonuclease VII large subunit